MVHISELATKHVDSPRQVVNVGDVVKVKIVEYDLEKRRISLSCKAAAEELGFEIEVEGAEDSNEDEAKDKKDNVAEDKAESTETSDEKVAEEPEQKAEDEEAQKSEETSEEK